MGYYQRLEGGGITNKALEKQLEQLENSNKDLMENIKFYQKKVIISI